MFWSNFKAWYQKPFATDMDTAHWFLFFGLMIIISVLWGLILRHITAGIAEV